MDLKPVKCVVIPRFSPIDKLVAIWRVIHDLMFAYRIVVAFCDVNIPTPEMHAAWDARCTPGAGPAYLIDIGEKKYHKLAGSASEVEKMSSETQNGRTWNMLAELVTENNQTGSLKQARHSIAKLIRDVYHVMKFGDRSQEVVFDHGMDVVSGFFMHQNKRQWSELFESPEFAGLRDMWNGFNVSEKEVLPFTLPLYFRQLFLSGRSTAEITEKISWWLDKKNRVDACRETARKKQFHPRMFHVDGKLAAYIEVSDYFEAEAFTYSWPGAGKVALAIIRSEMGHVHIQSSFRHKGADFTPLAEMFERFEPGRWYHETRFAAGPMLMNGSRQFVGVTPTRLTAEELMLAVSSLVRFNAVAA